MSLVEKHSQYYSGFSPTLIPGCALWLDAADSFSLTLSATSVTQWNDKSGNARHASGGVSPTYSNNGVVFNGSTSRLDTTYTAAPTFESIFVVVRTPSLSGNSAILRTSSSVGNSSRSFMMNVSSGKNAVYWDCLGTGNSLANTTAVTVATNTPFIGTGILNSTLVTSTVNGDPQPTTGASLTFAGTSITQLFCNGTIHEIIVYNFVVTAIQRQQVEGYLAWKWGTNTSISATHPFRIAPPVTRSFSPVDIDGCALWLDAADATTVALSGSKVTQWNDKSGNARHATQSTDAVRPTYANNALSFTKANSTYLFLPDGSIWSPANSSVSMFVVMTPTSSTNTASVFLFQGTISPANGFGWYTTGTAFQDFMQSSGAGNGGTTSWGSMTVGTSYVLSYIYTQNTNVSQSVNGTFASVRSQTAYSAALTNATIGAESPTQARNLYADANIREIIIYTGALAATQRQQVESYLAWKWGRISTFPTAHPFKLFPPLNPAFSPLQVSGCALWLDANDSSTLTLSGANVSQWSDKSGAANNAVATTKYTWLGPTVVASKALRFTRVAGTSLQMLRTQTGKQTTIASTHFVVMRYLGDNAGATLFDLRKRTDGYGLINFNAGAFQGWGTAATSLRAINYAFPSTFTIACIQINTNRLDAYANATLIGSSTATLNMMAADAGYITIGALTEIIGTSANQVTYSATTELNEVLMYNAFLTTTQRQQVEGYLAWKWGLVASLPSTHPYKKISP